MVTERKKGGHGVKSISRRFARIFPFRGVRRAWLRSFLLILILPIVIFILSVNLINCQIRSEIERSGALILDNVCQTVDENVSALQTAFSFVLSSRELYDLARISIRQARDGSFFYAAKELQTLLSNYSLSNSVSFFVYFHQRDYVVTNQTANESGILHTAMRTNGLPLDYPAWKGYLQQKRSGFQTSDALCAGSSRNQFVYRRTVFVSGKEITIFTMMPYEKVIGDISALSNRILLLADSDRRVFASSSEEFPVVSLEDSEVAGVRGDRYLLQTHPSRESNLWLALATPSRYYWQAYYNVNLIFAVSLVLALLLGVFATVYLTDRNYRPLAQLIAPFRHGKDGFQNEYRLLDSVYREMLFENAGFKVQVNEQQKWLMQYWLLSLLKGIKGNISLEDACAHYQFQTAGKVFFLFALSFGAAGDSEEKTKTGSAEAMGALLFALDNVFREVFAGYSPVKLEDGAALMYFFGIEEAAGKRWEEDSRRKAEFLCQFFRERFSTPVTCVSAGPMAEFEQIDQLYTEAVSALGYCSIIGYDGLMTSGEYRNILAASHTGEEEKWSAKLAAAVSAADLSRCREIANSIFTLSAGSLTTLRNELAPAAFSVLEQVNKVVGDVCRKQETVLQISEMLTAGSLEELRKGFLAVIEYACSSVAANANTASDTIVGEIKRFIEENYTDWDLSVGKIAERFAKNPNYISQIYFRKTGQGILDSIHSLRIRTARELLLNSDLPVEQIAERVGFSSSRTFRRVFADHTGSNPNQYRAKRRQH